MEYSLLENILAISYVYAKVIICGVICYGLSKLLTEREE